MKVMTGRRLTALSLGVVLSACLVGGTGSSASATQGGIDGLVSAYFTTVNAHSVSPVVDGDAADLRLTPNGAAKLATALALTEEARDAMAAQGLAFEHISTTVNPHSYVQLGEKVRVQAEVTTVLTDDNPQPDIPADSSSTDDWLVDVKNIGGQWFIDDVLGASLPSQPVDDPGEQLADAASLGLESSDDTPLVEMPTIDKVAGVGLDIGVTKSATPSTTAAETNTTAAASYGYQGPLYGLNYKAMADYALRYSCSGCSNSYYGRYGADCTNFVSQALRAGGWPFKNATANSYKNYDVWDWDVDYYWDSSYTWRVAGHLGVFTMSRSWHLSSIWYAGTGDVLQTDWDPNGRADGHIDHSMIVNGRDSSGPRISQHTSDRRNVPLQWLINKAREQGHTSITWYGYRT